MGERGDHDYFVIGGVGGARGIGTAPRSLTVTARWSQDRRTAPRSLTVTARYFHLVAGAALVAAPPARVCRVHGVPLFSTSRDREGAGWQGHGGCI